MTPVSHSFFGFTAGFVISPITEKLGLSRARTVLLCTAGSLLPDIDSISVFFNQQIYYGKDWYSHHALSHSIFGSLLLATVVMLVIQPFLPVRMFKNRSALKIWIVSLAVLYIGCLTHLPCDMVTCKSTSWSGGIPLFAPFSWSRSGEWCHMPWKDYYVIYMAIAAYLFLISIWLIEFLLRKKTLLLPLLSGRYFGVGHSSCQRIQI